MPPLSRLTRCVNYTNCTKSLENFRKELLEIRKKWKMKVGRSTFHLSSIWGLKECQRGLWENAFGK